MGPAVEAWQNARERMWYRSQTLLRQLRVLSYGEGTDGVDDSADDTWDEDRRGRRLLVVDDEPFILASLQRALRRYDVVLAEGGQEAAVGVADHETDSAQASALEGLEETAPEGFLIFAMGTTQVSKVGKVDFLGLGHDVSLLTGRFKCQGYPV